MKKRKALEVRDSKTNDGDSKSATTLNFGLLLFLLLSELCSKLADHDLLPGKLQNALAIFLDGKALKLGVQISRSDSEFKRKFHTPDRGLRSLASPKCLAHPSAPGKMPDKCKSRKSFPPASLASVSSNLCLYSWQDF